MYLLVPFIVSAGFIFGYFLSTTSLIVISCLCAAIGIFLAFKMRDMAGLITVIFVGSAVIANLVMWTTHYVVTGQTWFGDFLRHLLR